jgi:hypothetical protein
MLKQWDRSKSLGVIDWHDGEPNPSGRDPIGK